MKEFWYNGACFGYKNGKFVYLALYLEYFRKDGSYDFDAEPYIEGWTPLNVSFGGKLKYMDSYDKAVEIFGKEVVKHKDMHKNEFTGIYLQKLKGKHKILTDRDFEAVTKKEAKKMFYYNMQFKKDRKSKDKKKIIIDIEIGDFMHWKDWRWEFERDGKGVVYPN